METTKRYLLYVVGSGFAGGIEFAKVGEKWYIINAAPYIRKVLKGIPIEETCKFLTEKGFDYEWVRRKQ